MTNFDGSRCSCTNMRWADELKPVIKQLGGKMLRTINKQTDYIIVEENVLWPYDRYRSALYQNKNNKAVLISSSEFINILKDSFA